MPISFCSTVLVLFNDIQLESNQHYLGMVRRQFFFCRWPLSMKMNCCLFGLFARNSSFFSVHIFSMDEACPHPWLRLRQSSHLFVHVFRRCALITLNRTSASPYFFMTCLLYSLQMSLYVDPHIHGICWTRAPSPSAYWTWPVTPGGSGVCVRSTQMASASTGGLWLSK